MTQTYYQLLCGLHQNEYGQNFKSGDIVRSSRDLVKNFGSFRFRKLTQREIDLIEKSESKEPESKSSICGKCTEQFPDAMEKGLFIYKKTDGKYFIMGKDNTILMNDVSKYKVVKFINSYKAE